MPSIDDLTRIREAFLAQLDQLSDEAVERMAQAYGVISRRLIADLDREYEKLAAGAEGDPDIIMRTARAQSLLDQVEAEVSAFARVVGDETEGLIDAGIDAASAAFRAEMNTLLGPGSIYVGFDVLPVAAIRQQVAALSEGSPLQELLEEMGPLVRQLWSDTLVESLAVGDNPRVAARKVAGVTTGGIVRATRIARTEMMRSYREAHHANYENNDHVVKGWMWMATFGPRTCPACLSKHGQTFSLKERLNDHPNGRCTPAPITKTWAELGIQGVEETSLSAQNVETGPQWFARQPPEVQRQILGARGQREYAAGRVQLGDFAAIRNSQKWGSSIYATSVDKALANARKRGGGGAQSGSGSGPTRPPRPTPPAPASPARGTPVSAALDIQPKPTLAFARKAAAIIDSVHGDGTLPVLPVVTERMSRGTQGYFASEMLTDRPVKIAFRARPEQPLMTAVHEFGHFLDYSGIGNGTRPMPSVRAPVLDPWRNAVTTSRAVGRLRELANTPFIEVDGSVYFPPRQHLGYMLKPEEIFARSYAQYIAVRSGNKEMRRELDQFRAGRAAPLYIPWQWEDDDFEPIGSAFDEVFSGLGWR
jgi:SPP1 gp7 family putative phage head morphogenesis protein